MRLGNVWLCSALLCTLVNAQNTKYIVQVTTTSSQDMYSVADVLDQSATDRTAEEFLGVIDGTMTRVMDLSDSNVIYSQIEHPPTMSMINNVSFDEHSSQWTFTYKTLKSNFADENQMNSFYRILYFSQFGNDYESGDAGNACLCDRSHSDCTVDACLQNMKDNYIVNSGLPTDSTQLSMDFVTISDPLNPEKLSITVNDVAGTAVQEITIVMHTSYIKNTLGIQKTVILTGSPGDEYTATRFGIGMLFISKAKTTSIVLFDQFDIIENQYAHAAMTLSNSYSLAQHVQFYISRVQDTDVGLAHIEYYLDPAYDFVSFRSAINNILITENICEEYRTRIHQLKCYVRETAETLCQATAASGIISVTIPIPSSEIDAPGINIQTTVESQKTGESASLPILSLLNFVSNGHVNLVCKDAFQETFSPIDFVELKIYKQGLQETLEEIAGPVEFDAGSSVSTVQSLVTLVLQPKNTVAAATHFSTSTDTIQLDQVFMMHKLPHAAFPSGTVKGAINPVSMRMELQIPPEFYAQCPLEKQDFVQTREQTCVITKDYENAPLARPITGGYYLHEIQYTTDIFLQDTSDTSDVALVPGFNFTVRVPEGYSIELWGDGVRLRGNHGDNTTAVRVDSNSGIGQIVKIRPVDDDTAPDIQRYIVLSEMATEYQNDLVFLRLVFGNNDEEINTFLSAVYQLNLNMPEKARRYWAWPVYAWPLNPVGLIDETRLYMAWSVASAGVGRRLLQTATTKHRHRRTRPFEQRLQKELARLNVLPKLPAIFRTPSNSHTKNFYYKRQ